MKNIKRILALMLMIVVVMSVAGCHPKNEIAVTIGDLEFTSAYYMCALVTADSEAKSKVNESLTEEEQNSGEEIDYYSKKIDDKDYVKWVEDTAIEQLKKIAAYKTLCKENKLELEEDVISNAKSYASYYWNSYGYSMYYEPNGISETTYTDYLVDSNYSELYFEHLYGAEGEKAVADADVKAKLYENFVVANVLPASYTEEMTDAEKSALKTEMEGYANDIKNGKKTFAEIYKKVNNITEENANTSTETDEPKPKDEYATILGAKDTAYASDQYETVKAMANDEVKLITNEDGTGLTLIIKKDIKADAYYATTLDMSARHLIADKDYEKLIDDYAKKLDVDVNKYAVKQFKVKKIVEPQYN